MVYLWNHLYMEDRDCFFIQVFFFKFMLVMWTSKFCVATIITLVKYKIGDLNIYRAIAIPPACSKIFGILLTRIESYDNADDFQFGFKQNHSTMFCTNYFKKTVDYYTTRGSHVFTCFIDFNKAFDSINYWQWFSKLID